MSQIIKSQSLKKFAVQKSVYELSLDRIRHAYDLFDHISVMFSGGKDSTVVLNLALEIAKERNRLPLHVVHYDEEAIPYQVENYVRRVSKTPGIQLEWYCIPLKHTNACSSTQTSWITWNPAEKNLWVRSMPPEALQFMDGYNFQNEILSIPQLNNFVYPPHKYGRTGILMGIRAAESLTRYQAVSRREEENYIVNSWSGSDFGGTKIDNKNIWKVYPIYDWQTEDVWTAPQVFGWDYCEAYDLMEMAGISHHAQRIAPPYGTQPSRGLWAFKICFPELWEKMVNRVPGAQSAALYANTELYANNATTKPENLTWKEYIAEKLEKYDDIKMKNKVASQLRKYINTHLKKTGGLPVLEVAHPATGVNWEILAQIVIRKDNKGRIRPDMKIIKRDSPRFQAKLEEYFQALRTAQEEGALNGNPGSTS